MTNLVCKLQTRIWIRSNVCKCNFYTLALAVYEYWHQTSILKIVDQYVKDWISYRTICKRMKNAGFRNTKRATRNRQIYWVIAFITIHIQNWKSLWSVEKWPNDQTSRQRYENLVPIVLIISSRLTFHQKCITKNARTYNELIFLEKSVS